MPLGDYRKLEFIESGFLKRDTLHYLKEHGLPTDFLAYLTDTEISELQAVLMYGLPVMQKRILESKKCPISKYDKTIQLVGN